MNGWNALTSDRDPWTEIARVVDRLAPAFPGLRSAALDDLDLAAHCLALAFQIEEDMDAGRYRAAERTLLLRRVTTNRTDAAKLLRGLVPDDARFHARAARWFAEAEAARDARGGAASLQTEIAIAEGRAGLARALVSAMVSLSGREALHDTLCAAVTDHGAAAQLLLSASTAAQGEASLDRALRVALELGLAGWVAELRALGAPRDARAA